ncbi:MAG: GYF domain-containing protein [Candidatus Hydrogenedentota bacterium]
MTNEQQWHLHTQDGPQGPYTTTQLKQWLAAGQITPQWFVWQDGFPEWKPISDIPALSAPAAPVAPPPPPAAPLKPAPPAAKEKEAEPLVPAPDPSAAGTKAPVKAKKGMGRRAVNILGIVLVIAGIAAGATKVFAPDIFDTLIGTPPPPPVVAPPRKPVPPPPPPLDESALPEEIQAENVVIVIIDGPRYSETWGDTAHRYIPHIYNDLAPHGVVITNFRNEGVTKTVPGHVALWTGHYEKIGNDENVTPTHPGMGQVIIKEKDMAPDSVWIIASKDKIDVLATNSDPAWKNAVPPKTHTGRNGTGNGIADDSATYEKAIEILKRDRPRLAFIQFKEPDISGHSKKWDWYLAGLKASDEFAWKIWQFLESDSHYAGRTAFFITNDHGRHLDDVLDSFVSHGDDCEGCRRIILYASGPDFQKGVVVENKWEQIDLAVTAARLLGVRLPGSTGKIIADLFAAATGASDAAETDTEPQADTKPQKAK